MSLFKLNNDITPAIYPWAEDYFDKVTQSPWHHKEASVQADVQKWQSLSEADRHAIGGTLQGFTQLELHVGEYWSDVVSKAFSNYEVVAMARAFSHQESIHARAYQFLADTLGLDTYKAFQANPVAQERVGIFTNPEHLGLSLAIFSGAAEGVTLFASFALLLSYDLSGSLIGLPQIISWSARDENLHSSAGIRLYHQLVQERPSEAPAEGDVHNWFSQIVERELSFVSQAFEQGPLMHISFSQLEAYIKHRANAKLTELGFTKLYQLSSEDASAVAELEQWFLPKTTSLTYHDFFSRQHNGSAYCAMAGNGLDELDFGSLG